MFQNDAAEFVYMRTYARWRDDLGRRETWPETVERAVQFLATERPDVPQKVYKKMRQYMLSFDVLPSMRLVWSAGEAAKRDNTCLYNCSFLEVDSIEAFSETLYILMCGTGVGFSLARVDALPQVPVYSQVNFHRNSYRVPDSKEGWADSLAFLLRSLYKGETVDFDYGDIRPRGSRLQVMGGRASGPEPLIKLHEFVKNIFEMAQGRQLNSLEVHDIMCEIAEIVVVGGVRRSSLISLSELNDTSMATAKNWPFPIRRSMANNSAIYREKPDMFSFMGEWLGMAKSGTGERGIFNLAAAQNSAPTRRDSSKISGTNPCVTGDTQILTRQGPRSIESLVDTSVDIWNGFEWSTVIPRETGQDQKLLQITFSDGRILKCTPYHKFHLADGYTGKSIKKEAHELLIGDKLIKHSFPILREGRKADFNAYSQGFKSAEGMDNYSHLALYNTKYACLDRLNPSKMGPESYNRRSITVDAPLPKNYVPFDLCIEDRLDWLAGLLDGDGTELIEGGIQLSSVNRDFIRDIQTLLTTVGIQSKIGTMNKAGYRDMPDGKGGMKSYYCQETLRICIGAVQLQQLKALGMRCERLKLNRYPQRDASQFVRITGIEELEDTATVYCFTEPLRGMGVFNGILTGNCSEILLRSQQFCNLSTVIVRPHDEVSSLLDKVETATWIGSIQASFTKFPYLRKKWKQNCQEEALLGVSLSGQMDNVRLLGIPDILQSMKSKAIAINKKAAKVLGTNQAAAITCGKPEGTTSQLTNSGSGCHPWYAPFFIRRYRISGTDPLFRMMKDQGFQFTPENGQTEETATTWVVSFPCHAPILGLVREEVDSFRQLEWYLHVQKNWCEHNQSITIYVKPEEWMSLGAQVYENWDQINGVSFLPQDNGHYEQAPYEEITEEKYNELAAKMPRIDYSQLARYEQEDNTEGAKSYACTGDKCELR